MAFITYDGKLCRDMWPHSLARFPNSMDEASTLPESRLLPGEWDYLCGRVVVAGGYFNTERGVQVLSYYPGLGPEECPPLLCIRLQGIVGQVSLTPRGNWNGNVEDAVKALQSLILIDLYPDSEDSAFARQREAMHNLEELILNQIHGRGDDDKPALVARNRAINLRKRAFAMVKPGVVGINLTNADDPDGEIEQMADEWVVDHRIGTGVPNSKGRVSAVAPQAIRPGDMVDVAVCVEVVRRRGRQGDFMIEVMFCPVHVVKLKTADEVKAALANHVTMHGSPIADPTVSMRQRA